MATFSTGISVTWGGVSFTEVTAAAPSYAGGPSKGRSVVWTDEVSSHVKVEKPDGTVVDADGDYLKRA